MQNLKYDTDEIIYKIEIDSQKTNLQLSKRREGGEKDKLGIWQLQIYTTINKKYKQQGPTVQQRELYSVFHNNP